MASTWIPEPGVSRELADDRAARISALQCALHLSIPRDPAAPIHGSVRLAFQLRNTGRPVALDFAPAPPGAVLSCAVNDRGVVPLHRDGHVVLPAASFVEGANVVDVSFVAGDVPLNRRADHVYTIFVPARAREAFPCFDQPNLKARWTLQLEIPDDWLAVSNTEGGVDESARLPGRTRVAFATSEPLPTYLFAFAAGKFFEDTSERDGRELRVYYTAGDSALVADNRAAIIDAHAQAIAWLENYTGIPYPFGKFDIVLLPSFQFGGMEHPGAIFYNASSLLLTASATRQQLLGRAHVIAHETAHMWFGDLVTMAWFDDVWMKEVFANLMAARIVNPQFPDLDHELRFLHTHYPAAYDVDRTLGTHAIRQALPDLDDAGSLYGAIIYLKSPIVMRQLELLLGETEFRAALREYLARFAFGNASWPDLVALFAARTAVDIESWSRDWVDRAGRPVVSASLAEADAGWRSTMTTRADPTGAPGAGTPRWPQRIEVAVGYGSQIDHVRTWLDGEVHVELPRGAAAPDFVLPNGRGLGYGEFRLDRRSLDWLMQHLPEIPDPLTRGSAWLTLWDAMLAGDVAAEQLLDLAVRALGAEHNELSLQRLLLDTERLFWMFMPERHRATRAPALEASLRSAIETASAASGKAAVLACLRRVATSPETIGWLRALWSGKAEVNGLVLSEADRINLVEDLAIREPDGDLLVHQQLARTDNADRRDGLAFIAPALAADTVRRDTFLETISRAEHRRREPWVIEGLRCLHHPLRSDSALKYLAAGLDLLAEVKRTGDIFLPKRWLDATLGGHRSAAAEAIVRSFVDSRPPGYPPALVRMVLASGDHLLRQGQATGTRDRG